MNPDLQFLIHYGYALIFGWVLAEQLGVPVPSVPILLAAGALVGTHRMNGPAALALAIVPAIMADLSWYELGRLRGTRVLHFLCKVSLEPDSCVRRTEDIFVRNGPKVLLVSKFIPGLSTVAQPLAGVIRMKFSRFIVYDAAGAALYMGTFLGLGYAFSGELDRIGAEAVHFGGWVLVLALSALAGWLGWKFYRRRKFMRQLRIDRITPEELKLKLDAGEQVVIVDLRGSLEFEAEPEMIPGAVHLDAADLEEVSGELAKAPEVVLYCNCPNEVTSARMALLLRRKGVRKIRPLSDGLNGWRDLGYPVSQGADLTVEQH
jgi:membrane protein DedA with SNARE-associated domain/rhodanese-related sulfurtransferase